MLKVIIQMLLIQPSYLLTGKHLHILMINQLHCPILQPLKLQEEYLHTVTRVNDTLKLSHLPRSMFKKRGVKVSHC